MMLRRNFIQGIACGVGAAEPTTSAHKTVIYKVYGFSCVTCAVGLDAMLKDQKGILRCKSSYQDCTSVIEYNPDLINEQQIKSFIQELGFTARSK